VKTEFGAKTMRLDPKIHSLRRGVFSIRGVFSTGMKTAQAQIESNRLDAKSWISTEAI
jgi:hypothetical protein